jgi:uncharacterized membrane protein YhfC
MVDPGVITALIINIIICFGLPLGCILYLLIAKKRAFIPVLVGAAVFFVFQLIIRVPLLQYVLAPMDWYSNMAHQPWLYGIFLGLTAGLFEEGGRYLGYRTLLRKRTRWIDGFAFGVGHGGIEAITLVGLANINSLVYALMINSGQFDQVAALLPSDVANQIVSQLTSLQPLEAYLGGIERIFAFVIQIALSLMVLMAVRERKLYIAGIAVVAHMLVDAPVVILPEVFGADIYQIEMLIAAVAVLALVFIIVSRRAFKKPPVGLPGPVPSDQA